MFCTKCGTQVDQEDNFCKHCGVRIERRSATATDAPKPLTAAASSAPKLAAPQISNRTDARAGAPNLKERKSNKAVMGAVGVGVCLISAASIYFGMGSSKPSTETMFSAQREEPPAAKIAHNEPLASSEEDTELSVPADTRLASVHPSEGGEALRVAESSKSPADTLPPPSKSQAQRSGQGSSRNSRPAPSPASRDGTQPGVYETVHSTTVYEDPSTSANVLADIPAGVRIDVVSATGDWLEVHSRRGNPPGFIRRGDAVFVESLN